MARPDSEDAVDRRALTELHDFTEWLDANHVKGYVGEIGWPDDRRGDARRWNALARHWFAQADRHQLWVTVWATGEWWHDYPLGIYQQHGGEGVNFANTQAPVLEEELSIPERLCGVSDAGAEFGAPSDGSFSNQHSGNYGRAYHYDGQATFDYLAGRGIRLVRIPFRWERLQPKLAAELDDDELGRLRQAVARANHAGLAAILDMHNYGEYWLFDGVKGIRRTIGSAELPIADLSDVWRRISSAFKDQPRVYYGLMNEPHDLTAKPDGDGAAIWQRASQAALDAIRNNGDRKLVLVPGYRWSGVRTWRANHPKGWIADPADNFRYEAHQYWDADASGTYRLTYGQEIAAIHKSATAPATAPASAPK